MRTKYLLYDGTIVDSEQKAGLYLKQKIEEIINDIIFVQFKGGIAIDQCENYKDIIESFIHTNDVIRFVELVSKTNAIYIKTHLAAARLTKMCSMDMGKGLGSTFQEGTNFYCLNKGKFIPAGLAIKAGIVPTIAIDTVCKPIKEWIVENL